MELYLQANKKTRNRAYDMLVQIGHACGDEENGGKKEKLHLLFNTVLIELDFCCKRFSNLHLLFFWYKVQETFFKSISLICLFVFRKSLLEEQYPYK